MNEKELREHDPKNKECLLNYNQTYCTDSSHYCTCPVTTQDPTKGEEKQDWEADIYCCEGDRNCTEGRHDFIRTLIASAKEEERREVIEQVKEWKRNYMYEIMKHYGTDKHGIDPDDLGEFLESLKTNSK